MKIKINLNEVDESVSEICGKKLEEKSYPKCFGNMTLPILKDIVVVNNEDYNILKIRDSLLSEDIVECSPKLVELFSPSETSFALDQKSINAIKKIKEDRTDSFVKTIDMCYKCKFQEFCYKVTSNYLLSILILSNSGGK
jgi:hypothetical protein